MAPPSPAGMGGPVWVRCTPHALMVLAQVFFTLLYFITEAAFSLGLSPYVYVTYRHLLVACVLSPFAYFYEKKLRPKMTLMLFLEIFVLSLLGGSLTLNMFFSSLKCTSPTFVTSMVNAVASITFVIAIILGMEIVDVRSLRGLAKIAGAVQASSVKRYLAKLSLTAWMSMVGGTQSAVFAAFVQRNLDDWLIGFGLKFWCIVYTGIACNGLTVVIQLWCNKKKGPVFVTMFNPLLTVMVTALAYFIFGENLHVGSVIGGTLVILGLYMLLWGKDRDQQEHKASNELDSELDCEKQATVLRDVSAARDDNAPKTMK
ncbi:WAT1-related protein [Panicum miliaceum]|uniref:WAT1-related protein n=1 Tax=Panicum miliaceum TaxID=4540 RepID=A0A3L6TGR9_PANMI|nr:WAT1-related protein [Panicum miliaceum]